MECNCWGVLAMRKCVCGGHIKHICVCHTFNDTKIRYAHTCLSDTCILSSRNQWEFMCMSDHSLLATAELDRHCLQHLSDNWNAIACCWQMLKPLNIQHLRASDFIRSPRLDFDDGMVLWAVATTHGLDSFMVSVYEVRETAATRHHSRLALLWGFVNVCVADVASAVFARCLVMVE